MANKGAQRIGQIMVMKQVFIIVAVIVLVAGVAAVVFYQRSDTGSAVADTYLACGCGACRGVEAQVVYVTSKDEFESVKQADIDMKNSPGCATGGCSICTEYRLAIKG